MITSRKDHPIILASASPRRADLLREAGIPFVVRPPCMREATPLTHSQLTPRELAIRNAEKKARDIARRFSGRWVLGADTVVVLGRRIFGKPRDMREAEAMLSRLVGRAHRVVTGVCLCRRRRDCRVFAVTSRVVFKKLDHAGIRDYLRRIHPLDKAGAYAAQEHTDRIIARVEGSFSNVVGLPMERFRREWRAVARRS